MRREITALLEGVGRDYFAKGVARCETYEGHDIHAFYTLLKNPGKVLHVQGYAGMSSSTHARLGARLMDKQKMMQIRGIGDVSPGNEHEATIEVLPGFGSGLVIPYDVKLLKARLERDVPELK